MNDSGLRHKYSAVVLSLAMCLTATCGDDGSSSNDARGEFGEMVDALQEVETDYLFANAAILASAKAMHPQIVRLLEQIRSEPAPASLQAPCLPPGMGGRVYTANGDPFTSVPDISVPENTARFRLFALSPAGLPLLNAPIGHIDYICTIHGMPAAEVKIYSDSTLIVTSSFFAQSGNLSGSVFNTDLNRSLTYVGVASTEGWIEIEFDFGDALCANYSEVRTGRGGEGSVIFTLKSPCDAEHWSFKPDFNADETGHVVSGFAFWFSGPGHDRHLAACIEDGTLDDPVFSPPTTGCLPSDYGWLEVGAAELDAMSDACVLMRNFWRHTMGTLDYCRSLVLLED